MSTNRMSGTFWWKHGLKVTVFVLSIIALFCLHIASNVDDSSAAKQSRMSFLEYRQDQESVKILELSQRVEELEKQMRRIHGRKQKDAWE